MARAFTVYWTPEGWEGVGEGNPIRAAAGTGFFSKIEPGDRVYVTNVMAGRLRLLGSFTVRQVVRASESGKPAEANWDAPEYLLAQEESSSLLGFRVVPDGVVRELRFFSKDRPTVRAVRELTPQSAAILESLLTLESQPSDRGSRERLPVEVLNKATPQYVWSAVQALLAGEAQHSFGESTDYDLIADDGQRLPPKAVFGVALGAALGQEVLPKHFTAGGEGGAGTTPRGTARRLVGV
jgi:hypothetical protein